MSNRELLERIYNGRRAELKREILLAAMQCFLEQGIEATTIEMVRDRAEASVGAIYHHFKNKDGLVAALYLAALQDQYDGRMQVLQHAVSLQDGIQKILWAYIDWVERYPDFARFLYAANFNMRQGSFQAELNQQNIQRNKALQAWLAEQPEKQLLEHLPKELMLSLVMGATESYCRAWLSGKVKTLPSQYKVQLAAAAWQALNLNKSLMIAE
ncbi:TetR/AcrR family transcriptional regulator [Acinetobacter bouvetii]|uniref:HTH-type transcriptional repressor Bm3R1 n=1 Tax=Acinetobacter bouvetii TaxID=202951 RepID=A0A811G5G7_9GAMM|nr:TetR/AcrR family transcriptional regulator [Acinetobacter bouvetii]CAB1207470.1 HTH-type transcriptional repressor Bm3R1 [Acinetobacter bouvetii]